MITLAGQLPPQSAAPMREKELKRPIISNLGGGTAKFFQAQAES
ncbi:MULTISPECIES: hypothetical protein [unclassified Mesorhizobium]|nr:MULTISPECIES: hypothetical protein [unclassified Mesorhizobium]